MFSYYFRLMIEKSGSVPLTNGSGSRRPKNIRIRIHNTGFFGSSFAKDFEHRDLSFLNVHVL
jgi:hypothetical protein